MVVILLAALGVPLGVVLGVVGAGLWSRRRFKASPGVFAMRARPLATTEPIPKWPRRPAYARWVHDVLLVHRGVALIRNGVLPVVTMSPSDANPGDLGSGLGDHPIVMRLDLDGGEVVEIAGESADRDALVGPFRDRLDIPIP